MNVEILSPNFSAVEYESNAASVAKCISVAVACLSPRT